MITYDVQVYQIVPVRMSRPWHKSEIVIGGNVEVIDPLHQAVADATESETIYRDRTSDDYRWKKSNGEWFIMSPTYTEGEWMPSTITDLSVSSGVIFPVNSSLTAPIRPAERNEDIERFDTANEL